MSRVLTKTIKQAKNDAGDTLSIIRHSTYEPGRRWPSVGFFIDLHIGGRLQGRAAVDTVEEALKTFEKLKNADPTIQFKEV